MPELPEAETIARGLANCLVGRVIEKVDCRVPKLRRPVELRRLRQQCCGMEIIGVRRRGKGVIVDLKNACAVLIQLGMTGACRVCPRGTPVLSHEHILFALSGGKSWRYEDPRRFGMVESFHTGSSGAIPDFLSMLGPEPFSDVFSADYLYCSSRKRTTSIKVFLLNQKIIAGIGNIYASEILFRSGIRPSRRAGLVTRAECAKLARETVAVLNEAIAAGGTTIADYKDVDGSEGRFDQQLRVYGREGHACQGCGARIKKTVIGGRASFHCSICQH